MEISLVFQEHPDDDIWEEYAFGRVTPQQETKLEEHLLVCERCQKVLAGIEEYVRTMKFAMAHFAEHSSARPQRAKLYPFARRLANSLPNARIISAVATACVALLLWFGSSKTAARSSVEVPLRSLRAGGEVLNQAPARHPLQLSVPLADVPPSTQYQFELVTAAGKRIWSGPAQPRDGVLAAHVPKNLEAGSYWVRLYGSSAELLVEYGLKLD